MEKYEIEKLRNLPIEGVAEQLGVQVSRHKALCPFHDDHHASLSFNLRKNTCRCFVCMTESLDTIGLVMKVMHVDFLVATRWLAQKFDVIIEEDHHRQDRKAPHEEKEYSFNAQLYARYLEHPWLSDEARRFLFEERKIDPRVVRWCHLSSWTDREGTHWLQTPYYDIGGRLIGIQNRNLDNKQPRFRFPRGAKCSIYNLPVINRMHPGDDLYITEGCSDCWAMLSAGHKAIAIPSATLLSPDDETLLTELSERLNIQWHMYPDKDAPGERLFFQLKEILPNIEHHQLPKNCKDFGDCWKSKFRSL